MEIIRAEEMGMCFGVRDALQAAFAISDPNDVTIHGELVHNSKVIHRLSAAGFHQSSEDDRCAETDTEAVLITAHGVSNAERLRIQAADKKLIDTTCPLVKRVHDAAMQLQAEGRHVLLIGKHDHVEVRGIVEDLNTFDVIEDPDEVRTYASRQLGIVCQTTMPSDTVTEICSHIQLFNPLADIQFVDTVCDPTKRRQQAMLELVHRVDAVVVVGGRNSNNTRRLVQVCHEHGTPALHVQGVEDIDPEWFRDVSVVGLTAGTSTLEETVDEVQDALQRISHEPQRNV